MAYDEGNAYIELTLVFHFLSDNAVLVSETEDSDKEWLPLSRSKVPDLSDAEKGDIITLETQEWLAINKGFV